MKYTEEDIKKVVNKIVETCDPEYVYLFGSYARGDFNERSDIDLLVVEKGEIHTRKESTRIRQNIQEFGLPVDVIVATDEQMERLKNQVNLIYKKVLDEGKVYYARRNNS